MEVNTDHLNNEINPNLEIKMEKNIGEQELELCNNQSVVECDHLTTNKSETTVQEIPTSQVFSSDIVIKTEPTDEPLNEEIFHENSDADVLNVAVKEYKIVEVNCNNLNNEISPNFNVKKEQDIGEQELGLCDTQSVIGCDRLTNIKSEATAQEIPNSQEFFSNIVIKTEPTDELLNEEISHENSDADVILNVAMKEEDPLNSNSLIGIDDSNRRTQNDGNRPSNFLQLNAKQDISSPAYSVSPKVMKKKPYNVKDVLYMTPYKCTTCDKYFAREAHLNLHSRVHLNTCQICNRTLSSTSALSLHMKAHRREKNGLKKCKFCSEMFVSMIDFNEHVATHSTEQKSLQCKICHQYFIKVGSFKTHMNAHEKGKKQFKCDFCDAVFVRRGVYDKHLFTHSLLVSKKKM